MPKQHFHLKSRNSLGQVPSASGIVKRKEVFFVIGDNSPYLFLLDSDFSIIEKIPLLNEDLPNVVPKKDKPDFEAICFLKTKKQERMYVFGSGSQSPQRDLLVEICIENKKVSSYGLGAFYQHLRSAYRISVEDFNIEGTLIIEEDLLLFNRGNNSIFMLNFQSFLEFIQGTKPLPSINYIEIPMTRIKKLYTGFSAVTFLKDQQKILFTATVENTPNWIDDGEVMGSYLGFLNLKNLGKHPQPKLIPIEGANGLMKIKVEGIAVTNLGKRQAEIVLVTDSDGGSSEVLTGTINW